ncbi:alpha/beta hydrolase [Modestobacter marinus]|uniref:alpha/beta hydrolase n=1 Tax=Modestobacter marinus TaxID=477641 RepID=UPI001C9510A6|nr:alpha/beta hydrolase [Modestobacter marinus]
MTGPRPGEDATAAHTEGTLGSGQYWQAWAVPSPVGVVVLVHGLHEHGGRYGHVAGRLARAGYATYVVDHPGHGRSPGVRGNISTMAGTVDGVDRLVRLAGERHPGVPLFVYGHSMGGLIALTYLTGSPEPRVRGAVISAPALDTSAAAGLRGKLLPLVSRLLPDLGVLTLDAETISRDPAVVRAYRTDPLTHTGQVRARTGAEMTRAAAALPDRLRALRMPLFVLHGGADRLVPTAASEVVPARATSAEVTRRVYDGLFHESHNEPEQERVLDDVVAWLDAHRG